MTWEETVLDNIGIQRGFHAVCSKCKYHPCSIRTCDKSDEGIAGAQAKYTWETAIREVVKWIQSHQLVEPSPDSITRFAPFYQIDQAELKELGGSDG